MATTLHFCDGAESRDLSWASSFGGLPVTTASNPATGDRAYSLVLASGQSLTFDIVKSGLDAATSIADTRVLVAFKIRFSDITGTTPPLSNGIFNSRNDASQSLVSLVFDNLTDQFVLLNESAGTAASAFGPTIVTGQYYRVEIFFERSATGAFEVWIDGVSEASGTDDFQGVSASNAADIRFGDSGVSPTFSYQIDDIYVMSDDTVAPTPLGDWRVEAFQGGSGATTSGPITGLVTDVDELPTDDGTTEVERAANSASHWYVECDAAGTAQAGPLTAGLTGTIKMAVYYFALKRGNGGGRTLEYVYGNTFTIGLTSGDLSSPLTTGYQPFFQSSGVVGTSAGDCPDATVDMAYGITKSGGNGGQSIFSSTMCGQILFQEVVASLFIKKSLRRRLRKVF